MNAPVVQRRQLVREIEDACLPLSGFEPQFSTDVAEKTVAASVKLLLSGLKTLLEPATSAQGVQAVAKSLTELDCAVFALQRASKLRPSARPRAYLLAASEVQQLWPLYRQALTTLDVGEAQREAVEAQRLLNSTGRHLDALAADIDAVEQFASMRKHESFATQVFRGLQSRNPGLGLPALMDLGRREYATLCGKEAGAGAAVDLLIIQLVARLYLDPAAISEKFVEISELAPATDRVREVSRMTAALDDLGAARRDVFEALHQFHLLSNAELGPAALLRRLAKTTGELYEAALPIFAWARLLLGERSGDDDFIRLVRKDSTALADSLRNSLPKIAGDLHTYLRHAGHHGRSFEVDVPRETISIQLRSHSEQMTFAQYIDKVYALLESVLVIQWSIANWLEISGVEVPMDAGLASAVGLTPDVLLRLWLEEGKRVSVRKSVIENRVWFIEADLSISDVLSTAVVAAGRAGEICDVVEVKSLGSPDDVWHMNIHAYEVAMSEPLAAGAGAVMRILRLRHSLVNGDACSLSNADLEYAAIVIGANVLDGELRDLPHLREVRHLSQAHGAAVAEEIAVRAIRAVREGTADEFHRENAVRLRSLDAPIIPTPAGIRMHMRSDHIGVHARQPG